MENYRFTILPFTFPMRFFRRSFVRFWVCVLVRVLATFVCLDFAIEWVTFCRCDCCYMIAYVTSSNCVSFFFLLAFAAWCLCLLCLVIKWKCMWIYSRCARCWHCLHLFSIYYSNSVMWTCNFYANETIALCCRWGHRNSRMPAFFDPSFFSLAHSCMASSCGFCRNSVFVSVFHRDIAVSLYFFLLIIGIETPVEFPLRIPKFHGNSLTTSKLLSLLLNLKFVRNNMR